MVIPVYILALMGVFSVVAVSAAVWYIFKVTGKQNNQTKLISLLIFCMVLLTTVYLIDKIVSVRTALLTDNENTLVFSLIKDFLLIVTGYFFARDTKE